MTTASVGLPDVAHSTGVPMRGRMQRLDHFEYEQDYLEHGNKEYAIPAAPDCSPRSSRRENPTSTLFVPAFPDLRAMPHRR